MKNTLETRLGIFFALALIAAVLIMETIGSFDVFKHGIRIHARFKTVQELKEGDPVKMAGVQIGRVEKIDLKESKVDVTLKLDRAASVKTDSKAMIKFAGLMGQNFVSISFGSRAGRKVVNDTIIETEEQPDLNALMVKLENVATGGNGRVGDDVDCGWTMTLPASARTAAHAMRAPVSVRQRRLDPISATASAVRSTERA